MIRASYFSDKDSSDALSILNQLQRAANDKSANPWSSLPMVDMAGLSYHGTVYWRSPYQISSKLVNGVIDL